MKVPPFTADRGAAWLMVIGLSVSLGLFGRFVYQTVSGWQQTATLLAHRHTEESAELLALALQRDMRAVQESVLMSPQANEYMLGQPLEVSTLVASAFARYPYPELFFGAQEAVEADRVLFFSRSERTPDWLPAPPAARFPVTGGRHPDMARALAKRIASDAARGRRFSLFETSIEGASYQVVARLTYQDSMRQVPAGTLGFMVNVDWVRRHYFPEVTRQVTNLRTASSGPALTVLDERGEPVVGERSTESGDRRSRRGFQLFFFDPRLVALDVPVDLPEREWAVVVNEFEDPELVAAIRGARRTLWAAAASAIVLFAGVSLSARAIRARAAVAELRSDFVSTVTHELKTPIAAIRALGDTVVSGRVSTPAAHRQYAIMVVQESKRLSRLIDNLLAYSRIADVTEAYQFEALSPATLIEELLFRFRTATLDGGFHVHCNVSPQLPLLRADCTSMELLLDNLFDNALRYAGIGRDIYIDGRVEGHCGVLSIRDTGVGISREDLPNVARKFYRGRRSGSGGSGLGFAIVNRIASDHGGRVSVESEVSRGTTVHVAVPLWCADG